MLRTAARKLSLSLVLVAIIGAAAFGAGLLTPADSYAGAPYFEQPVYPETDWPISYGSSGSCTRDVLVLKHIYVPYVGILDFWVWEESNC